MNFRSPAAYRHDFCDDVTALEQRFTRPLPDGATVYIPSTHATWRLYKDLGSAYDANTLAIVIPADQSNNRWVLEDIAGASPWSGVEVLTATNVVGVEGSGAWAPLGSTAGSFALATGLAATFAVNPTSSLLTYHGPTIDMLVTASASVGTTQPDNVHAVISRNDDVPDASSATEYLKGEQAASAGGETDEVDLLAEVTVQRGLSLVDGDTLRLMLRNDRGQSMSVSFFALSVVPR